MVLRPRLKRSARSLGRDSTLNEWQVLGIRLKRRNVRNVGGLWLLSVPEAQLLYEECDELSSR